MDSADISIQPVYWSRLHFHSQLLLGLTLWIVLATTGSALELNHAVILTAAHTPGPEKKAVTMLVEEVEKRTYIRWQQIIPERASNAVLVAIGTRPELEQISRAHSTALK